MLTISLSLAFCRYSKCLDTSDSLLLQHPGLAESARSVGRSERHHSASVTAGESRADQTVGRCRGPETEDEQPARPAAEKQGNSR